MYDYMAALYQQFFRGPDFTELEEDIERTRQEVQDCLSKEERRKLLRLVDLQNLRREGTFLAVFTAGFKLTWGIARALELTEREANRNGEEARQWRGQHPQTDGWALGGPVHSGA